MSASALDANNADTQGVTYSLDSPATGQATVSGYAGSDGASIVIPAQVSKEGNIYNVVSIDFWGALYGKTYSSFTVSNDNSFLATDSNGLLYKKIDNEFWVIWGGVSAITNITIPESINGTNVTGVLDFAFFGNASLSAIQFDDNMKYINGTSFQGVSSLTSVTFGAQPSLLTIGDYVFFGTSITSFVIPASVTSVGNMIFGSSLVTSVTIPNSITSVDFLNNATYLTNVVLDQNNPNFVFYDGFLYRKIVDGLEFAWVPMQSTNIGIPSNIGVLNVISIGDSALRNAKSVITSVSIPTTVLSIGANAFNECSQLTSVTIPNAVTLIGDSAFQLCTQLTSVLFEFGGGVKSIGDGAFCNSTLLTSVNIPGSVTSIGSNAFGGCPLSSSLSIPDGVTSIGEAAFINCANVVSVHIGANVTTIGTNAFGCPQLSTVTIDPNNSTLAVQDGIVYQKVDSSSATISFSLPSITSVVIPAAVTMGGQSIPLVSIPNNAFNSHTNITSISISDSVITIGNNAFNSCTGVTSIHIGANVAYIGDQAFGYCLNTTTVTIPASVTYMGNYAFIWGGYMQSVYFLGDNTDNRYFVNNSFEFRKGAGWAQQGWYNSAPWFTSDINTTGCPPATAYYIAGKAGWDTYASPNSPPSEFASITTFVPEGSGSGSGGSGGSGSGSGGSGSGSGGSGSGGSGSGGSGSGGSGSGGSGSTPSSNVCFPAKTPVMTNQGPVNIEDIDPAVHTIRNKKIVAITKTVAHDKNLVRIAKHALGHLYPEKTTFISQNHKVLCQGQMIKAKHLVNEVKGVTLVPYNGQVLYNVLLEEHEKMQVNNLIVETLHPEHKVAKLYRFLKNVDAAHHGKFIALFNKCDREQRQSTF